MHLQSLSLATLGLLFMANGRFGALADPASQGSAIAFDGQELSGDYLSAFSLDNLEDNDVDFELSEEIADTHVNIAKRADCSKLYTVTGKDTCSTISKKYGISLDNFYSWNPQVKKGCPNLHNGKKYCVGKSSHVKKLASKKSKGVKKAAKKGTKKASSSKESRKKLQTKSAFTYYWIAQEEDYKKGHNTAVKTCSGQTIEKVSEDYADALVMEGTGVIGSKIVNLGGCSCSGYKCFEIIDKKTDPYGLTSYGTPLRPYATIASNDLKKNTKIFVPGLVGWKIPGSGKTHNGCLLVDDESWSFKGHHIDFYVYAMKNYKVLDSQHHINSVDIYEGGSCKLLNYM